MFKNRYINKLVKAAKVATLAVALVTGLLTTAPEANAQSSSPIVTELTTAGTSIEADSGAAIGFGLKVGIIVVGGFIAWGAFKKFCH